MNRRYGFIKESFLFVPVHSFSIIVFQSSPSRLMHNTFPLSQLPPFSNSIYRKPFLFRPIYSFQPSYIINMESRRSSLPGSRIPNGSTSSASSSSSRGVLRQFRPAISDQWLSNDMKAVNRRSSLTNTTPNRSSANSSSGGLIKERRYHQYHHHHSNAQSVSRPVNSNGIPLPLSSAALSPSISAQSGKLTCPECLVVVDSIQDLEIHFQKRHSDAAGGSSSALLFCPHCSEAIKHRTNLHRHIRVSCYFHIIIHMCPLWRKNIYKSCPLMHYFHFHQFFWTFIFYGSISSASLPQ